MSDELKEFFNKWFSFPLRNQIEVDFDLKGKIFSLSVPIFSTRIGLPESVKKYIETRRDHIFKPHDTSFFSEDKKVILLQKIPFVAQSTLRQNTDDFFKLARHLHRILSEIATEEKFKDALELDAELAE